MARILDDLLGLIKWPVAVLAVVCLPTLMEALNYFHIGNIRFFYFLSNAVTAPAGSRVKRHISETV